MDRPSRTLRVGSDGADLRAADLYLDREGSRASVRKTRLHSGLKLSSLQQRGPGLGIHDDSVLIALDTEFMTGVGRGEVHIEVDLAVH